MTGIKIALRACVARPAERRVYTPRNMASEAPRHVLFAALAVFASTLVHPACAPGAATGSAAPRYPPAWWTPIPPDQAASWEILPQAAQPGEVIVSKRGELGILSNFAHTPFTLDGVRYESVEGFWQMMLFPEGPDDERAKAASVTWTRTRAEVLSLVAFEAKRAGDEGDRNMKRMGIDWVTYRGQRMAYRGGGTGEHHALVVRAMRQKLLENPEVRRVLLATGDLVLRPDHHEEPNAAPAWRYCAIWMIIRAELRRAP
jgi:predicted NAD-dependent protein-ADP-ribosyltransferase YbiA (DUF1768 family)